MAVQVLSGITFTKLIGMSVLALTRSKLLEVSCQKFFVDLSLTGLPTHRCTTSGCG